MERYCVSGFIHIHKSAPMWQIMQRWPAIMWRYGSSKLVYLDVLAFKDFSQRHNLNNNKKNINVIKKEAEKILKYKELIIEIQRTWNVRAKMIRVKTEATGTISKSLRQNLSNIPGKHEIKELQKAAVLDTAHTYCGKC